MLTPQEVSERAFQKASFGGYNMSQVDEFLDILTGDYSALYSENAVLKSKMKVLVDKVEEYRSTEEAMRKALMAAQRMAEDLVKEAEQKKEAILKEAEGEAIRRKEEISRELQAEEYRLQEAQKATAAMVAKIRALTQQQESFLDQLDQLCPPQQEVHEDPVEEAVEEIDDSVQRLLQQAMREAAEENRKAREEEPEDEGEEEHDDFSDTAEFTPVDPDEEPEEDEEPPVRGSRIDFGSLQFGRDYEIK
ncbi:DivIVA domain-containing protein [Pseudoflavonifractor sp. AF19-9AC]|uniref:DivIVA domain-containing protein n=1 Tax=Pseudoflavonifractor sp. AF19-9AC TaxID=2292244 RepID=UPI000E4F7A33|nr:DivIVA domain-containing protein [Pseudoflavonifractor sp. AF19-9AC]RHR10786.1 DivIVA domain-containing protein [Pseudoflavonifractor sp. AF19-9AC]